MNADKSRKKISALETNDTIYKNDLKRMSKTLKKEYGIDEEDADERLIEIDEEMEVLERKKRKLKKEIESELENVNA